MDESDGGASPRAPGPLNAGCSSAGCGENMVGRDRRRLPGGGKEGSRARQTGREITDLDKG